MGNIVLTSCGIRNEEFKERFYEAIGTQDLSKEKLLYITTAPDGELGEDTSWIGREFQTILDLGFRNENIYEYKIGKSDIDVSSFNYFYMLGGNSFYLIDMIKRWNFDKDIKALLERGGTYIGSSAGSIVMGNTTEYALPFDENNIGLTDFTGLKFVDATIVPHANKKKELIDEIANKVTDNLELLYDGDGIIIKYQKGFIMELIDIVDENGNFTGEVMEKNQAHDLNLLHWEVATFIVNSKGQTLLQRRSANKRFNPNMWAVCAGHVDSGEKLESAALREIKEELGIDVNPKDLYLLDDKQVKKRESNSHILRWYYVVYDNDDFKIELNELSEVKWFEIDEVIDMINKNDESLVLKSNSLYLLERLKEQVNK